ncbi:hypothetical protein HK104_003501 [Borealophlyctis nickersoniae]|nr:hypothetical protein HK104_003501 [Borealophlyctis nickersoniae]
MIPIARSIPNIAGKYRTSISAIQPRNQDADPNEITAGPTGATQHADGTGAPQVHQAQQEQLRLGRERRRSSLDNIMENLKYIGAFPSRIIADFSQPHHQNTLSGSTSSSTSSLFTSQSSLQRFPSFTDAINNIPQDQQQQQLQQQTRLPLFTAAGTKLATDKGVKFPSAEEFLTF